MVIAKWILRYPS